MNSVTNRAFMAKKKMYKQPETEIVAFQGMTLMDVSINEGGGGGTAGAPGRASSVPDSPHL